MFGGDHENKLKKKDIIEKCITKSNMTDRKRIVMVGDTLHDALGARQSEIDFIGVTYGFGFNRSGELDNSLAVGYAENAKDILKYIL